MNDKKYHNVTWGVDTATKTCLLTRETWPFSVTSSSSTFVVARAEHPKDLLSEHRQYIMSLYGPVFTKRKRPPCVTNTPGQAARPGNEILNLFHIIVTVTRYQYLSSWSGTRPWWGHPTSGWMPLSPGSGLGSWWSHPQSPQSPQSHW